MIKKNTNPSITLLENNLIEGDATIVVMTIKKYFLKNKINEEGPINASNCGYFKLLSIAYKEQGEFRTAENITKRLLAFYTSQKDKQHYADCYLNLAVVYSHISKYNEALKNLFIATKLFEELGVREKIAKCEQTLSLIYFFLEYYDEAIKRILSARKMYEEAAELYKGNAYTEKYIQHGLISCRHLLGVLQFELFEKREALSNLNQAKEEAEKTGKGRLLGYIYQDLGRLYLLSRPVNAAKAEFYLEKSEKIRATLNDRKGIAICLLYRGMLNSKMAKWERAIKLYRQAILEADNLEVLEISIKAHWMLFEALSILNRHADAISIIKSYEILKKREAETKKDNQLNLEMLLPLNATIKDLNAQLAKSGEIATLAGEVLDMLVVPDAKFINRKPIAAGELKSFNAQRKHLKSNNFESKLAAIIPCLNSVRKTLSSKVITCKIMWNKNEEYLLPAFHMELIKKELIVDCGIASFKKIMTDCYNDPDNSFIKWNKTIKHLAFLFYFLEKNKLLDPEFPKTRFEIIKSKFKQRTETEFTNALSSANSEVTAFMQSIHTKESTDGKICAEMKALVEGIEKKHSTIREPV